MPRCFAFMTSFFYRFMIGFYSQLRPPENQIFWRKNEAFTKKPFEVGIEFWCHLGCQLGPIWGSRSHHHPSKIRSQEAFKHWLIFAVIFDRFGLRLGGPSWGHVCHTTSFSEPQDPNLKFKGSESENPRIPEYHNPRIPGPRSENLRIWDSENLETSSSENLRSSKFQDPRIPDSQSQCLRISQCHNPYIPESQSQNLNISKPQNPHSPRNPNQSQKLTISKSKNPRIPKIPTSIFWNLRIWKSQTLTISVPYDHTWSHFPNLKVSEFQNRKTCEFQKPRFP